jgi:hypothetical protein
MNIKIQTIKIHISFFEASWLNNNIGNNTIIIQNKLDHISANTIQSAMSTIENFVINDIRLCIRSVYKGNTIVGIISRPEFLFARYP